jgi:hypothetical protein
MSVCGGRNKAQKKTTNGNKIWLSNLADVHILDPIDWEYIFEQVKSNVPNFFLDHVHWLRSRSLSKISSQICHGQSQSPSSIAMLIAKTAQRVSHGDLGLKDRLLNTLEHERDDERVKWGLLAC